MLKRIAIIGFLLLLFPGISAAQSSGPIAVAPFAINSQEDLGYLSQGIQDMIGSQLTEQGLPTLTSSEVKKALGRIKPSQINAATAVKIGRQLGASYVIFGSLTKLGEHLSLDIKIAGVDGPNNIGSASIQTEGLENLNAATAEVVKEISAGVSGKAIVDRIIVEGSDRIEKDAVRQVIQSKEGEAYSAKRVSEDMKRIHGMGFFDDVQVDVTDSTRGKVVRFIVREKGTIQRIEITGNDKLEREDLIEVLGYNVYTIVNPRKIVESVENMKTLYRDKGYYHADIQYEIEEVGQNSVAVKYNINEGKKIYIDTIEFEGNEAFSDWKLRQQIETSQWHFWSYFFGTGVLNKEKLRIDVKRLNAFYYNHGYIKARIGEPKIDVREDGIYISIQVEEGDQYRVGDIRVTGDLVEPEEKYIENLKLKKGEILNRQMVQKDVQTVTDITADKGYAFADVNPDVKENSDDLTVDITYQIDKKSLVSFERISVVGNDKTRDKVIRREIKVNEGDLYSAEGLRVSQMNLDRLGYFKEVQIVQKKGSADDLMDLEIQVEEQPTGSFSIGAGYSSFNSLFGTASISESNLFGTGRKLSLETTLGAASTEVVLHYTEPWLFDIPLSAGLDVFYRTLEYDSYQKDSKGFGLRAGYPIQDFLYISGRYQLEFINIHDVDDNASSVIKDIEGDSTTSAVLGMIRRDTRNKIFNTTKGSDNSFSAETAGGLLGGTNSFSRFIGSSAWWVPNPLWEDSAFMIRGKMGYMFKGPDGELPAYEKFYLGGINSVRGFKWGKIGPRDAATGDYIGGEKMMQINMEFTFPLASDYGLTGVVFFDQGNVWSKDDHYDITDLKRSYGGGLRFNSPLGPLRLEYGRVIAPKSYEPEEQWEFAVGAQF